MKHKPKLDRTQNMTNGVSHGYISFVFGSYNLSHFMPLADAREWWLFVLKVYKRYIDNIWEWSLISTNTLKNYLPAFYHLDELSREPCASFSAQLNFFFFFFFATALPGSVSRVLDRTVQHCSERWAPKWLPWKANCNMFSNLKMNCLW